jgi:hypothetical protein
MWKHEASFKAAAESEWFRKTTVIILIL